MNAIKAAECRISLASEDGKILRKRAERFRLALLKTTGFSVFSPYVADAMGRFARDYVEYGPNYKGWS